MILSPVLAGPLADDPLAIPEFQGTAHFNSNEILKVDVDFAVFSPGTYPDDAIHGEDPSDGAEFVYAYQVFNVSATRDLTTLSITLDACTGAHHLQTDPLYALTGGKDPVILALLPDSVIVDYLGDALPAGGYSTVFLFASPNPPTMVPASVLDGGQSDIQLLPVPQPGPTIPSDLDGDCDVDLDDLQILEGCTTGPAVFQPLASCRNADLDEDGDVDQSDFGLLQRCFSGTDVPADPACVLP
jgi:hypothetical protein